MYTKLIQFLTKKIYIIVLFIVFNVHNVSSQNEYFESGAVWHHQYTHYYYPNGYSKTFVNGNLMVAGMQAVVLSGEYSSKDPTSPTTYVYSGIVPLPDMYMRSSNDSVFIFREGAFHLAYKTNAVVGEVWDLGPNANYQFLQDNHSYLRVDSVYFKVVNGENLRHLNTTACYANGSDFPAVGNSYPPFLYPLYEGVFNEKYGPEKNFREMQYVGLADTSFIIDYFQNQFLCYESDSTVQLSSIPNVDCFQYVYLGTDEKQTELLVVSPNPSEGVFEFINPANVDMNVVIYDPIGRVVQTLQSLENISVDISKCMAGTYIAQVRLGNSFQTVRLILL